MTVEEMQVLLLEAVDRIAKLEAEVKRLDAEVLKADKCPDCHRPGMLCYTCDGTGRKSGARRR